MLDELQIWEKGLKHAIKKAEVSFDSLDDAGEMTFGNMLDQEEKLTSE